MGATRPASGKVSAIRIFAFIPDARRVAPISACVFFCSAFQTLPNYGTNKNTGQNWPTYSFTIT